MAMDWTISCSREIFVVTSGAIIYVGTIDIQGIDNSSHIMKQG